MFYSLKEKSLTLGKRKGEKQTVAHLVTNVQRIEFDQFCRSMAEGASITDSDVVAVLYKMRSVLRHYCALGYVVDAGPLGRFMPHLRTKAAVDATSFTVTDNILSTSIRFKPAKSFSELTGITFERIDGAKALRSATTAKGKKNGQGVSPGTSPSGSTPPDGSSSTPGGVDSGL